MDSAQRTGAAPLVIASNRGPVERRADAAGHVTAHRGGGGLIAVLGPALASAATPAGPGVWVAEALTGPDRALAAEQAAGGPPDRVDLPEGAVGVRLLAHDPDVYRAYYGRVSTELLWFLQHHLLDPDVPVRVRAGDWECYRLVNADFAAACAAETAPGGTVLIQDYHLSLTPRRLRALRPDVRSAHFTMTPWATPARFAALPRETARELVDGLLGADLVCFLVPRWARCFLDCCAALGLPVDHERREVRDGDGRVVRIACIPVGVDGPALRERAARPDVRDHVRSLAALADGRRLAVRVDRMEPSKNIARGLTAYARLLERRPELRREVLHYVLAYTSRGDLPAYRAYAAEVHELAADVNARFGTPGRQPVVLETRNDFGRGLAAMELADVLVVNPLRDGMNLVAKEGPVVSRNDLALVLSREAGAADELYEHAALVDPLDTEALAGRIGQALALPARERAARLARLREAATACPPRDWLARALAELSDDARTSRHPR